MQRNQMFPCVSYEPSPPWEVLYTHAKPYTLSKTKRANICTPRQCYFIHTQTIANARAIRIKHTRAKYENQNQKSRNEGNWRPGSCISRSKHCLQHPVPFLYLFTQPVILDGREVERRGPFGSRCAVGNGHWPSREECEARSTALALTLFRTALSPHLTVIFFPPTCIVR